MGSTGLSFDVPPLASLARQIESHLERLIVDGTLASGQRLSEPDIAKRFQTSRSPVREALRRLEQAGLVVIEPRRGASVRAPTRRDLEDMVALREALEGMAARLAAERASDADLVRLRALVSSDAEAPSVGLEPVDFHELLAQAAANPPLQAALRGSLNLFRMLRSIPVDAAGLQAQAAADHRLIFAAVEARDRDAAEAAARVHIRTLGTALLSAYEARRGGSPPGSAEHITLGSVEPRCATADRTEK